MGKDTKKIKLDELRRKLNRQDDQVAIALDSLDKAQIHADNTIAARNATMTEIVELGLGKGQPEY